MLRSMYSAISGLKAHQQMLDVTANNIANVNTIGFKAQRTTFMDALAETLQSASAANGGLGGRNAVQIGLGVQVGAIDNVMTSGPTQSTSAPLDVSIQGDGFYQVATCPDPTLASPVFGTTEYTRAGNFTRDANGYLETSDGYYVMGWGAATGPTPDKAGGYKTLKIPTTAQSVSIGTDGSVNVDVAGTVSTVGYISLAKFPNDAGLIRTEGNRFIASPNSGTGTAITTDVPGRSGLGSLIPGSVEMSNVDLAQEFTDMITAQRGFQANSRTITTADELLQELVNLKH